MGGILFLFCDTVIIFSNSWTGNTIDNWTLSFSGNTTTGTPGNEQLEETYPIEGKVLYENNETYNKFNGLNKPIWIVTVKNGQNTVVYNGVDYIATRYTDYYYDSQNDRLYFTREFLLQFLSQSDLDGIASYNVNIKNKKITPILP